MTPDISSDLRRILIVLRRDGVLFLVGLFLFGALFSFSVKRKRGQSVAYRIIEKPSETRLENPGLPE